ncbi:MAG: radical SAM protein [Nanobdellota archaeon]
MVVLTFSNFSFYPRDQEVQVFFTSRYFFTVSLSEFCDIDSDVIIREKEIEFPSITEKKAENKCTRLLDKGLHSLTNTVTNKPVRFIDEMTGVPLIGSGEFGVVDRDTNILELKPLTGCNLNCIYCSVDEGVNDKSYDILIDPFFLAEQALAIAVKKNHRVEFNIGPHGEPLLYPFLEELVSELKRVLPDCVISINTNGTLLNKQRIDSLILAGLTRVNLSLNSLDQTVLSEISGKPYPLKKVLDNIEYCKQKNLSVLIAPLVIPTYTDSISRDIKPLIKLSKSLPGPFPTIGFQNYLVHKYGRKPVKKQYSFEEFFSLLSPLESECDIILTPKKEYNPFDIYSDVVLEIPMKKNAVVRAEVMFPGRHSHEMVCSAHNRLISVRGLETAKKTVSIRIIRNKHNIFIGVPQ